MAMDEKGLGQRLQQMRKSAGLTQQDLCHKANLSYSTLAKIERGAIKSPSIFTIQNIAAALGVGLDALLGVPAPVMPAAKPRYIAQNGVRFVYFDINGCLVRFFHAGFTKLAAATGARPDEVENLFWHYNDAVCRGEMSLAEFNGTLCERLKAAGINWQDYYMESIEPMQEMHELVNWVAERYYVGLVSNIMPGFIQVMQRQQLIPNVRFDSIVDSSVVGAIKPERKIYEVATQQAGVEPQEIMLIDDDRANLIAAERLGWQVLWFDDYRPEASVARIRSALEPADNPAS
jgi:FMN phosphatase YigB (HAD superfamily)/DNA-binding Xre family transcriptional regulator